MDQYNVITPTNDIDDLNNQYYAWCNLPYNFRMRSNEECIRRYGITNLDLYERIKASIMARICPEDEKLIGGYVSEAGFALPDSSEYHFDSNVNYDEFDNKMNQVKELESSPNIVIINPFRNPEEKEYDIIELNDKWNKYCMLTIRNKRFSDAYSLNIWGYTVYNMYEIMKDQLSSIDHSDESDGIITLKRDKVETEMEAVKINTMRKMTEDDTLGLMNIKLDACQNNLSIQEKVMYDKIVQEINHHLSYKDYYHSLPKLVPFLTMDEAEYFEIESNNIRDYYPGMQINEASMELARQRQAKWLEAHSPKIIDITRIKRRDGIVLESTSRLNNIYEKHNLYPVYIVLSYNKRFFTKLLRVAGHLKFTHSGLALDSDLKEIYTFNYKPGTDQSKKGFNVESLDAYLNIDETSDLMVLTFFIDKEAKTKISNIIADFREKKPYTKYAFKNLFRVLFNKAQEFDPNNLAMVCSQFVDAVLKLANLDITGKTNNLVTPDDFRYLTKNPKIFKVYDGITKAYTDKETEDRIYSLFTNMQDDQIKYSDMVGEACNYIIESYYCNTENYKANQILSEIRELLKPESIFDYRKSSLLEFKFPIRINDKGDMIIKLYKSLEEQYQEAHRLLKSYGKDNLEGIKHELARLFYINAVIEKKIKKMEKADENYKKYIDLRARVLNDFKKYFKIVLEAEPDFDFAEYFKKSEYYNGEVTIDNSVMKFTGALIKKLLKIILGE